MGKIVRGARLVDQAYVVAVPVVSAQPPRSVSRELDERFGAPHDAGLEFDHTAALFAEEPIDAEAIEPGIDIEQLRADARALVDAAAADAEKMLRDAAAQAHALLERAEVQAATVKSDAREAGHEEGLSAGRTAGQAELAEQVAAMQELVESVRAQRNIVVESAEPELVKLAMGIAERIVHEQISIDPNVVLENVKHALTRLIGREVVTLRVNPADLEILRQYRDSISSSNDVEHLRVVEDQRVDRGGVVIETDAGTIDAKIATQVREANRALQSGEIAQAS
ncbi:MAG TPA: FliH/SctL family protein [Candidatus Baltobacteraceae bacterium]|nr:FliH/SctL family protein [Candidatus Baltobacteraceae bacterium]